MRNHWNTVNVQHPHTMHSRVLKVKTSHQTTPQSPVFPCPGVQEVSQPWALSLQGDGPSRVPWERGCPKWGLPAQPLPKPHTATHRESPAQPVPSLVPHQWIYYLHNAVFNILYESPIHIRTHGTQFIYLRKVKRFKNSDWWVIGAKVRKLMWACLPSRLSCYFYWLHEVTDRRKFYQSVTLQMIEKHLRMLLSQWDCQESHLCHQVHI